MSSELHVLQRKLLPQNLTDSEWGGSYLLLLFICFGFFLHGQTDMLSVTILIPNSGYHCKAVHMLTLRNLMFNSIYKHSSYLPLSVEKSPSMAC